MVEDLVHELPEPMPLALVSAGKDRDRWLAGFALDARCARIVATVREPILAQMRLAWWRDMLGVEPDQRPAGDPLLDLVSSQWRKDSAQLAPLIDAWETLLAEGSLADEDLARYAGGRAVIGLASMPSADEKTDVLRAGRLYALVDFAIRSSDTAERRRALALAHAEAAELRVLSRRHRPLAVLAGLSKRYLRDGAGEASLLGDRLSPFVAMRLSMFGR